MENYKVLTKKSCLDIEYINDKQYQDEMKNLQLEVYSILATKTKSYESVIYHFFNSHFFNDYTEFGSINDIDSMIERLSIKNGFDIVQFNNGNIGFVAYYNEYENGFEILF